MTVGELFRLVIDHQQFGWSPTFEFVVRLDETLWRKPRYPGRRSHPRYRSLTQNVCAVRDRATLSRRNILMQSNRTPRSLSTTRSWHGFLTTSRPTQVRCKPWIAIPSNCAALHGKSFPATRWSLRDFSSARSWFTICRRGGSAGGLWKRKAIRQEIPQGTIFEGRRGGIGRFSCGWAVYVYLITACISAEYFERTRRHRRWGLDSRD